jgi:hypothetical protein
MRSETFQMTNLRLKSGAQLQDIEPAAGVFNPTVSAVVNGRAEHSGIAPTTQLLLNHRP